MCNLQTARVALFDTEAAACGLITSPEPGSALQEQRVGPPRSDLQIGPLPYLVYHSGHTMKIPHNPVDFLAWTNDDSITWRQQFIQTFLERDVPQLGISIPAPALLRL